MDEPAAPAPEEAPRRRASPLAWALRLGLPAALIGLLLTRVDVAGIGRAIAGADPRLLAASVLAFPVAVPFRVWRWHWLLRRYGIAYPWRDTLVMFLAGFAGQFLLPTGLGDMLRLAYLVEDDRPVRRSLMTLILDKGLEISGTLIFGFLGFFVLPLSLRVDRFALPAAAALALAAAGAFLARRRVAAALQALLARWLSRRVQRLASSAVAEVWRDARVVSPAQFAGLVALTAVSKLLYYGCFFLLAEAMHLGLSYVQVVAVMGIVGLVVNIPGLSSSIGGLGVREGAMYALFLLLGRSGEAAIAFALLIFAVSVVWHGTAVLSWFVRPVRLGLSGQKLWAAVSRKWQAAGADAGGSGA